MNEYEYGVALWRDRFGEPHRTELTEEAAHQWIAEYVADGGAPGVFFVIRREVGPWLPLPAEQERT